VQGVLILAQIDGFLICVRLTLAFVDGWCSERVTFGAGQAFFCSNCWLFDSCEIDPLAFVDGWCSERVTFGAGRAYFGSN
jgi:hypothetical protein